MQKGRVLYVTEQGNVDLVRVWQVFERDYFESHDCFADQGLEADRAVVVGLAVSSWQLDLEGSTKVRLREPADFRNLIFS